MEVISKAYEPVLKILKQFQKKEAQGRTMKYCIRQQVGEGVLLFNLMTRELLLLTEEEDRNPVAVEQLWERWFVVPQNCNEKELVDFVKLVLGTYHQKTKSITQYVIYTTTDCNARCFYCFQHGTARISMTQETAKKLVLFIKSHCDGKKVQLQWFGGEPLLNIPVIDTICDGLREVGVEFESKLVTNGYLLNNDVISKAVGAWNVRCVQVALDGTEKNYNRVKAYVSIEDSPYQAVLRNLERLQKSAVSIIVRMNIDLYNAQDLMYLVDELGQRFADAGDMRIYVSHLFKQNQSMADVYTSEEWDKREAALSRIEEKIAQWGMSRKKGISKTLNGYSCKADSGRAINILPTGDIGVCEIYTDSEFVGHVDREKLDPAMVASWQEKVPPYPECSDCVHYPDCRPLKKCPGKKCFDHARMMLLRDRQREIHNEYEIWKHQTAWEENMEQAD